MTPFSATKQHVANRGSPPDSFLEELLSWAKSAKDEIFLPNSVALDIFTVIKPDLGSLVEDNPVTGRVYKWDSLLHRKAAMMEAMRVHAGFESSWNWNEGVDTTNRTSMANKSGQETGIFQVSFDSEWIANGYMKNFAKDHQIETADKFIPAMKSNHWLALEYYARLVRVNIKWAGPLIRHVVNQWLRRDAVAEFMLLLA